VGEQGWASELVGKQAVVLHVPTKTVGTCARYYDGDDDVFTSPVNGEQVPSPVISLGEGHSFLASEEAAFIELSEAEVAYHRAAQAQLGGTVRMLAALAANGGVSPQAASILLISALQALVATVTAAHARQFGGGA
jgi:hypothetical protein